MHSSHHDIFNIPTTLQTQRSIHNTQPGCTLDVLIATAFITNASSMLTADLSERTFDMEEGLSTPVGNRRSFFVKATILISSIIGLSLAIPIVGYLVITRPQPETQCVGSNWKNRRHSSQRTYGLKLFNDCERWLANNPGNERHLGSQTV